MPTTPDASKLPSPLRILHLEDSAADAALIAWTLSMAGIECDVKRVEDEESYVAALRQGDVDLILSDSNVAGFSGLAALDLARATHADVPFVFVSGNATPEMGNRALRLGAVDCISKEHRFRLVFLAQQIWQSKKTDEQRPPQRNP